MRTDQLNGISQKLILTSIKVNSRNTNVATINILIRTAETKEQKDFNPNGFISNSCNFSVMFF